MRQYKYGVLIGPPTTQHDAREICVRVVCAHRAVPALWTRTKTTTYVFRDNLTTFARKKSHPPRSDAPYLDIGFPIRKTQLPRYGEVCLAFFPQSREALEMALTRGIVFPTFFGDCSSVFYSPHRIRATPSSWIFVGQNLSVWSSTPTYGYYVIPQTDVRLLIASRD